MATAAAEARTVLEERRNSIGFIAIRFTPSSAAVATGARMRRTLHTISSSTCWIKAPWAEPQRGRFRNFLLGALDHFLANAAERAGAANGVAAASGCFWMTMPWRIVISLQRQKG